jgi:protein ImuA
MAPASPPTSIADLRHVLERLETPGARGDVLPFGVGCVDEALPGGGLARGELHEVIEGGPAAEYAAVASLFTAGILARLPGPVLWCLRGRDLFGPALARVGLHPDRVIFCETFKDCDVLPAMEEGLRCAGLGGVIGELTKLPLTGSRRLKLAARHSGVTALVLRRWRTANERELTEEPNAASTRWRVGPAAPAPGPFERMERPRWAVELLRARGGEPHSWILEACDAAGHISLPATLADGSAAVETPRRIATG